jgi:phenylacetic acid degradation operon negative regulatory protein
MIARLLKRLKPRARSVIITVYGDSIMHHGGAAWLGSVIELVAPLGLNERVVRTSVFRLAKENWLAAEQIGRRSFYRLTEEGRRRCDAAHGRIYHRANQPWDRHWTFVVADFARMPAARSRSLRSDLRWQGFGQLASGVMLHPDPDEAALRQLLIESGVGREALVLRSTAEPWATADAQRDLIARSWDMKQLAADYRTFLDTFRPVWSRLGAAEKLDPQTCFVVRTLLMHGFRRVLLRDPKLPEELLPANWPGTEARLLCRDLYKLIQGPAEQHLMARLQTADGPPLPAHPSYYYRFGGLPVPRGQSISIEKSM